MANANAAIQKAFTAIIPFQKDAVVDEEERIIEGYATTGSIDEDEQIISQKAVADALKPYSKYPTIRADHGPPPVGKAIKGEMDTTGLNVQVQIGKDITACDDAWESIKQGLYTAFSIGGKILETKMTYNKAAGKEIETVTKLKILEISLTDSPANRDCFFEVLKSTVKDMNNGGRKMTDADNKDETNPKPETPETPDTPDNTDRLDLIEKQLETFSGQLAKLVPASTPKPDEPPEDPNAALKKELIADIRKELGITNQDQPNRGAHQQSPHDVTAPPTTAEEYSLRKSIKRSFTGFPEEEN